MRRLRWLLLPLLVLGLAFGLAGCGGGGQHKYTLTLPSGRTVTSAHSPTFGLPPKKPGAFVRPATGVQTVLMLDTVNIREFNGLSPFAVAGYTSGYWPTYFQMAGHYRYVVSIAVNTSHNARCLDVEPGDATPSQAVGWFYQDRKAGFSKPCFYASLGNGMGDIIHNLSAAGISRASYWLWDADWTRVYHLDSGMDCTQYDDTYAGRNIDPSACTPAFVGAQPAPKPKPSGPSAAQVRHWVGARGASLHAYYRGFRQGYSCHQPVLTSGYCGRMAWRVDHFQKLIDTAHGYYPHCFGSRRNLGAAECRIVRPAVATWSRAVSSTVKAEGAKGCEGARAPRRSRTCDTLRQREHHFRGRIDKTLGTSRL